MRALVLLTAIGAVLLFAAPVQATAPADVLIQIDTTVPSEGLPFGPFTATGPVCPSGTTVDVFGKSVGFASGNRLQILVVKQFTCADGSGTFSLLFRVHITFEPFSDTFTWTVVDGTGAYTRLHGSGSGFGTPTPNGATDTLTGGVHID